MLVARRIRPTRGHARIVSAGLGNDLAVFQHAHGAELEDGEFLPVKSLAALPEDDWPRCLDPDEEGDREQKRGKRDKEGAGDDHVENAF